MAYQTHRGSFSQGSWIGEMQQASDKSVIISEILDPRTKNLLSMSKISDYVLSNELVSMALAMVAEDRQINDVLEELFAEEVDFCFYNQCGASHPFSCSNLFLRSHMLLKGSAHLNQEAFISYRATSCTLEQQIYTLRKVKN